MTRTTSVRPLHPILAGLRSSTAFWAWWLVVSWMLVLQSPGAEGYLAPSTRAMGARLERLVRQADPLQNPFLNRAAAAVFKADLERFLSQPRTEAEDSKEIGLRFRYGLELLNSGETARAIEQFEIIDRFMTEEGFRLTPERAAVLRMSTAIAYLRLGEQENCLNHHTIDSCLLPIQGQGVHQLPRGSRGAIGILETQLRLHPDDLKARWLLNLAQMTLGEYPTHVPPRFLIPPGTFQSETNIGRFPDVAGPLGLDLNDLAGGVVWDDFDNDGDLDLMTSSWGLRDPLRFFVNEGNGKFRETTRTAGLAGETGGLNLVQADYNNDGFIDVLVLRGAWFGSQGNHPNSLLRNNGDGTFRDVTEEAGLLSFHPTQTATWLDYNLDGWIDVFIGNETTEGAMNPCELYRNNGDGTFTECAREAGITALGLIKAVHSGDYDNDGRPDLYISCRGELNFLYHNDGPAAANGPTKGRWKFSNRAAEAGVTEPRFSFPAWFFDYDNDGWLDLFVCDYDPGSVRNVAADYLGQAQSAEKSRLYRNLGNGAFTNMAPAMGLDRVILGMSGNFGDLDNDGFLDLYVGTGDPDLATLVPNRMFRNDRGRRMQEITSSGGFGHIQKGHGIAFADLDNDGDQDVYVSLGGAYEGDVYRNALFANPGHGHSWITLKLVGTRSNRAAIGARLQLTISEGGVRRRIFRTVASGGSFGASPLRQEIGLGQARRVESLEVWWPASGTTNTLHNLAANSTYLLREGEDQAAPVIHKPFRLPLPGTANSVHHH